MAKVYCIIFTFISLPVLTSCWTDRVESRYKWSRELFLKYTGNLSGLDSIIRVDGYYKNDAYNEIVVFYRDGTAAITSINDRMKSLKEINEKIPFYAGWGSYKLKGDIIQVQTVERAPTVYTDIYNRLFRISSDTSIVWLNSERESSFWNAESGQDLFLDSLILYYHPDTEGRPDSICWLKDKSWFWENRSQYKEYKQKGEYKQRKRMLKQKR